MMYKVLLLACFAVVAAQAGRKVAPSELAGYSFERYVADFAPGYAAESHEGAVRRELFEARLAAAIKHNADPSKTWKKTVNQFSDRTEEERAAVRGGRLHMGPPTPNQRPYVAPEAAVALPDAMDWRDHQVISSVKDQGRCGSCWTFGTTETVESHAALKTGSLWVLSEQQLVDCCPNTNDCGGTGGCGGGTPEIAYEYLIGAGGQAQEFTYPYRSYWAQEKQQKCVFNNTRARGGTPAAVAVESYVKLPSNNYQAVMTALATVGPLAINVQASTWQDYAEGIFPCTQDDTDIDHVVQLVGYGTYPGTNKPVWIVRNSWSPAWGEHGYIYLERHDTSPFCGIDEHPKDGTGCNNSPPSVKVCGSCALLYDVSYPIIKA